MIHIDWTAIIVAAIAFIGSAGIWTFIDHKQQRQIDKEMRESEVMKELKAINSRFDSTDKKIDDLEDKMLMNEAKSKRVRILRFADEVFMDINHSKDSFDQVLSDITDYEDYCKNNPGFKNRQTAETCDYILDVYHKRMEKKDFARYGRNGGV